jgi:hypothetical protein
MPPPQSQRINRRGRTSVTFTMIFLLLGHCGLLQVCMLVQRWWRRVDSNHGPTDYETVALAT